MIAAAGLTRRFGSRVVVDNVSFEVGRSEIVALLGPNGAGKTTTRRMLAGLIAPSAGTVTIAGAQFGETGHELTQGLRHRPRQGDNRSPFQDKLHRGVLVFLEEPRRLLDLGGLFLRHHHGRPNRNHRPIPPSYHSTSTLRISLRVV